MASWTAEDLSRFVDIAIDANEERWTHDGPSALFKISRGVVRGEFSIERHSAEFGRLHRGLSSIAHWIFADSCRQRAIDAARSIGHPSDHWWWYPERL